MYLLCHFVLLTTRDYAAVVFIRLSVCLSLSRNLGTEMEPRLSGLTETAIFSERRTECSVQAVLSLSW